MLKEIIKEILSEELKSSEAPTLKHNCSGYHMIRTYSAGVHFGKIEYKDGKEIKLVNARRVHYWEGACSLSQLAIEGSKKIGECRISVEVPEIILTECIEIIKMTTDSYANLTSVTWRSDNE
jgi:hypothetical protein